MTEEQLRHHIKKLRREIERQDRWAIESVDERDERAAAFHRYKARELRRQIYELERETALKAGEGRDA